MHPAVVASLVVTFGMLPFPATTSAVRVSPAPAPPSCNFATTRGLIIWERSPRLPDSALEGGGADLMSCKPTLSTWKAGQPTGPGYCSKIAWASDNPGYRR